MPRRILLLITDLEIGGSPTVVRELARRLHDPDRGVEIDVACLKPAGPVADQIRNAGISVSSFDAQHACQLPGVIRELRRLVTEKQIDTVFSFLIHANVLAAMGSRKLPRVRFIQSIQTTQPNPRWHWRAQKWASKRAECIVVPSASAAEFARRRARIPEGKIVVIPNAVDASDFEGIAPAPSDMPLPIGFLGRLDPIKRVQDLVRAAAVLRDRIHLHIFGEGVQRREIERVVSDLRLEDLVTLHGAVSDPRNALERVAILVLPSEAEGFGLVLIEAMAAGRAVVATNVPGIRDVVRDGETGLLVPPDNPGALAGAIEKLIEDEHLRQKLIDLGLDEVGHRFGWQAVMNQYHSLLKIGVS